MSSEPYYNEDNVSVEILIDYLFKELSAEQEEALDLFLEGSEEYTEMMDSIMDFCIEKQFKTKKSLIDYLEKNKADLLKGFKKKVTEQPKTTPPTEKENLLNQKVIWYLLAACLLFLMGYGIYKIFNPTLVQEPPVIAQFMSTQEREAMLKEIWIEEREAYTSANSPNDNWEYHFVNEDYAKALAILNRLLSDTTRRYSPQDYYFAGLFNLYLEDGDASKALNYLLKAEGFRNDTEDNYSLHLIIAYLKNNQPDAASNLLNTYPQYYEQLPPSIQNRINRE